MAAALSCDVAVVGSGPGGAVTACTLAEAGVDVLVLEEGPHLPLESCAPFSREELEQKYRAGGITVALGHPKVAYVEGRCVGGGSEINSGLYHRTPPDVIRAWARELELEAFTPESLAVDFEACERDLSVSLLPGAAPPASLRLDAGASSLGWRSLEVPRWYRYDDDGRGERQSMTRTYIPRALAAGARLEPGVRVDRLRRRGAGWRVEGRRGAGPTVQVEAREVVVACGAVHTPLVLQRSGLGQHVGRGLRLHPTAKVVAEFATDVNAPGLGVPVHQVKEFAPRYSFGCSISAPPHLAMALLDHPEALARLPETWTRQAVYYVMTSGGRGSVRSLPGSVDPMVRYGIGSAEWSVLEEGQRRLCECLFAAGAERLYPSFPGAPVLTNPRQLPGLRMPVGQANLMTIHLFASCKAGERLDRCAVDSFGRVHGVEGVYVADASLLGGAPGVNPQGSVMAFARRNARRLLERRG